MPLGQIHESFLELGVLILEILYDLLEGNFSTEINNEKMRNMYEKPVIKKFMICKFSDFKDLRKFKFVNQKVTKILLAKFKLELPFRLTKDFEDKMNS